MQTFANVIFDLDGTLMNSAAGIVTAYSEVAYKMRVKTPPRREILSFIGHPLRENLKTFIPEDKVDLAVEKYYRCYDHMRLGLLENSLYDGILEALDRLLNGGFHLYLITGKLEEFVLPILNMFGLEHYFSRVLAEDREGTLSSKSQLIPTLLDLEGLAPTECVMVGDRALDVKCARDSGVASIGVTWGYGSLPEMQNAQPDYIVHAPEELATLLCEDHLLYEGSLISGQ